MAIEVDVETGTSEKLKATIGWQHNLPDVLGNTRVLSGSRLPFQWVELWVPYLPGPQI